MAPAITLRMTLLLVAAVATGGFGVVVLSGNSERTANRFLAAFLFLISANHVAEFLRAYTTSPASNVFWYQVASVFSALDPLLLYYFASIYPERNSLNDRWKVGAVTGITVILAAFSVVRAPPGPRGAVAIWADVLWGTATVGIYLVVLGSVVHRLNVEGAEGPLPLLVAALSVVTLPAIPRPFRSAKHFISGYPIQFPIWEGALINILFTYGAVPLTAALLWWSWASEEDLEARRVLRRSLLAGLGLTLLIYPLIVEAILEPAGILQGPLMSAFKTFGTGTGAALRWIAFSGLVSQAIVRHDMLGMSLKARRRTARTLVATGVVGIAGLGLLGLRGAGMDAPLNMGWSDLVFLGGLAAFTQGFKDLIDQAAHRFYGVPPPGNERAAMEVYREAVDQAAEQGRDVKSDGELRRLEEELELDPATARTIREMATASSGFELEPGAEIAGRYRVADRLGETRAGSVCLARDELLDRDVVLKPVELGGGSDDAALEEARTAGSIQHPNILAVHDVVEGDDAFLLVTEHAGQGSLAKKVRDEGPLGVEEGVRLVEDVLAGLQAVHDEGLVHRDVKPSNVLLTDSDVPKVSDFGVAQVRKDVDETFDEVDVLAGTPAYMAPEQQRGEVATPGADLFAVGRLMGRCLEDPLPPGLKEIQERALEQAPEERWESAEAMREALRRWRRSRIREGSGGETQAV